MKIKLKKLRIKIEKIKTHNPFKSLENIALRNGNRWTEKR